MFKEFKISDVFYKIDTPKIKAKANDFPTEYSEKYCVPLLTAGAENQGLNRYAKTSDCPMIINNAISVSANGANSGICFYQPHDFAVLQDAYAVKVNVREIDGVEEGLYLTGALNKAVRDNHDWVNKAGWNHIKDDIIELPVIENPDHNHEYTVDDIDWDYMRERITELERERITELDAYLQATGLNDYELTEEDKNVLSEKPELGEFKSSDLFDIKKGKRLTKSDMINGNINFVGSSSTNNGITAKVGNTEHIHPAKTFTVSYNGSVGEVFLQDESFWASDDVNVWYPKFPFNTEVIEYIMAVVKKHRDKYSYTAKWTIDKMRDEILSLPIKFDGTPNFDYMERYIRAMEKVVIADVVRYKDKVIEETRKVVGE